MKHTQGEKWQVNNDSIQVGEYPNESFICKHTAGCRNNWEKDAKLIAAAPVTTTQLTKSYEMLTVLMNKLNLNLHKENDKKLWDEYLKLQVENEAALKKATEF